MQLYQTLVPLARLRMQISTFQLTIWYVYALLGCGHFYTRKHVYSISDTRLSKRHVAQQAVTWPTVYTYFCLFYMYVDLEWRQLSKWRLQFTNTVVAQIAQMDVFTYAYTTPLKG